MIKSFRDKSMSELWSIRWTKKIDDRLHAHIMRLLDALDAAGAPEDMNVPGFDLQGPHGSNPPRYAVRVDRSWRITFEFEGADARRVTFEPHH